MLKVLIDTWWNVNVYTSDELVYTGEVLIDTWWNVNYKSNVELWKEKAF